MSNGREHRRKWLLAVFGLTFLAACTPYEQAHIPPTQPPVLTETTFQPGEGSSLPLRYWPASGKTRAVIVALHGFNDYSRAFDMPARYFASRGIATYAIDQRGFGLGPEPGKWAGRDNLVSDAKQLVRAARAKWPRARVYLMGESMGGAVAAVAMAADAPLLDGLILSAPAVWGEEDFNPLFRIPLWLGAHTVPWYTLTGEDVDVLPSDNFDMLLDLGQDPLVIKESRMDAILGLVRLMDEAHAAAPHIRVPTLLLYGERDQIIPPDPVHKFAKNLQAPHEFIIYPDGWHMLERDLQREVVWKDIARWVLNKNK